MIVVADLSSNIDATMKISVLGILICFGAFIANVDEACNGSNRQYTLPKTTETETTQQEANTESADKDVGYPASTVCQKRAEQSCGKEEYRPDLPDPFKEEAGFRFVEEIYFVYGIDVIKDAIDQQLKDVKDRYNSKTGKCSAGFNFQGCVVYQRMVSSRNTHVGCYYEKCHNEAHVWPHHWFCEFGSNEPLPTALQTDVMPVINYERTTLKRAPVTWHPKLEKVAKVRAEQSCGEYQYDPKLPEPFENEAGFGFVEETYFTYKFDVVAAAISVRLHKVKDQYNEDADECADRGHFEDCLVYQRMVSSRNTYVGCSYVECDDKGGLVFESHHYFCEFGSEEQLPEEQLPEKKIKVIELKKDEILPLISKLRADVDPQMRIHIGVMEWDDELVKFAQGRAEESCSEKDYRPDHPPPFKNNVPGFPVVEETYLSGHFGWGSKTMGLYIYKRLQEGKKLYKGDAETSECSQGDHYQDCIAFERVISSSHTHVGCYAVNCRYGYTHRFPHRLFCEWGSK